MPNKSSKFFSNSQLPKNLPLRYLFSVKYAGKICSGRNNNFLQESKYFHSVRPVVSLYYFHRNFIQNNAVEVNIICIKRRQLFPHTKSDSTLFVLKRKTGFISDHMLLSRQLVSLLLKTAESGQWLSEGKHTLNLCSVPEKKPIVYRLTPGTIIFARSWSQLVTNDQDSHNSACLADVAVPQFNRGIIF